MYIKALFLVDEEKVNELNSDITTEFGWVEESGIHLLEYQETEI